MTDGSQPVNIVDDDTPTNSVSVDSSGDAHVKSKVWDGTDEVAVVDNKLEVSNTPYIDDIARGVFPGKTALCCAGFQDNGFTTSTFTLCAGEFNEPHSSVGARIISSSSQDSAAGTGARKVMLIYLDSSWVRKTEVVTMNGTSYVTLTATDIYHIERLLVVSAGSNRFSEGTISLRATGSTTTYIEILPDYPASQVPIIHVPAGKTVYVHHVDACCVGGVGRFMITAEDDYSGDGGDTSQLMGKGCLVSDSGAEVQRTFDAPIKVSAQKHFYILLKSSSAPAEAFCGILYVEE